MDFSEVKYCKLQVTNSPKVNNIYIATAVDNALFTVVVIVTCNGTVIVIISAVII